MHQFYIQNARRRLQRGCDLRRQSEPIRQLDLDLAPRIVGALWERGIEVSPMALTLIRCITHLDVDAAGIDRALAAFREVAG